MDKEYKEKLERLRFEELTEKDIEKRKIITEKIKQLKREIARHELEKRRKLK